MTQLVVRATAHASRSAARFAQTLVAAVLVLGPSGVAVAQPNPPAPSIPTGPYRIAGIVVNSKTGAPLVATVEIQDPKNQSARKVIASNDGHFEFHVPAGKFGLRGARHGFVTSFYEAHEMFSSAIVTGAGLDTEHLVLRLPPNAVLTGKIVDETGEPVRGAEVRVYREDRSTGSVHVAVAETSITDDQGAYEASPLAEGTYFLAAQATPWYAMHPVSGRHGFIDPSLDVAFPITYYGDTSQPEEATPIPVRGGDRLQADIHLTPVPAAHITFHSDTDAGPIEVQARTFDGYEQSRSGELQPVSPGVFEVTGLAPGEYRVRMPDASGELKAPAEMNISGSQDLDILSAASVSTIKLTIQMRDGSKLPERMAVALRSPSGSPRLNWKALNDAGQITLSDVTPGRYDLLASSYDHGYEVVRISSNGDPVEGKTLEVPAGAALELSASIVNGTTNIEGVAKRAGKPSPGAMIVLVPENPESNRERFRRDQSDQDGTFTLYNVVPGKYTVIAIEDGWDLDWAKPTVLAPYLPKGQTINVSDESRGAMHLSAPVQIQKK